MPCKVPLCVRFTLVRFLCECGLHAAVFEYGFIVFENGFSTQWRSVVESRRVAGGAAQIRGWWRTRDVPKLDPDQNGIQFWSGSNFGTFSFSY